VNVPKHVLGIFVANAASMAIRVSARMAQFYVTGAATKWV
jgi:hypothetical protein